MWSCFHQCLNSDTCKLAEFFYSCIAAISNTLNFLFQHMLFRYQKGGEFVFAHKVIPDINFVKEQLRLGHVSLS